MFLQWIKARQEKKSAAEITKLYAHDITKALTGLAGGGSENFYAEVDGVYFADIDFCINKIRERIERAEARARAEYLRGKEGSDSVSTVEMETAKAVPQLSRRE